MKALLGPTVRFDLASASAVCKPPAAEHVYLLVLFGEQPIEWLPIAHAPGEIRADMVVPLLSDAAVHRLAQARAEGGADAAVGAEAARSLTVAVCTRDRPDQLARCLPALRRLDPPPAEVLVVDSASRDGAALALAGEHDCRAIRSDRPGLSIARNLALAATRTPWLAFTDDDAEVPPHWAGAMARALAGGFACVTAPVVPTGIETPAQAWFEAYGGLNRGFLPAEFDAAWLQRGLRSPPTWLIGAGASMGLAVEPARAVGAFDPLLGAGTRAACSEDTDLFYRLLRAGHRIRYEPRAWVLHSHRMTMAELRRQLFGYGCGHVAAQWKAFRCYGDRRGLGRVLLGLPWLHGRRLARACVRPGSFPPSLIVAEAVGGFLGPFRWRPQPNSRKVDA